MTIKDLEYFIALTKEKSISKAAARLYIAQPALSQCLQKLENELGYELFVRTRSGIQITVAGECFLRFANKVLQEKQNLTKQIHDATNSGTGEVTLGFTSTHAPYVLPNLLPAFQERFHGINISLVEATTVELVQMLISRKVDLALLHLPLPFPELNITELFKDEMVLIPRSTSSYQKYVYHRKNDPKAYIRPKFFAEEPMMLTSEGMRSRYVLDQIFTNMGVAPIILQTSRRITTLDALARVDYCSTIIPERQVSPEIRKQRIVCYFDPSVSVPYTSAVATLKDSYLSFPTQMLYNHLVEEKDNLFG